MKIAERAFSTLVAKFPPTVKLVAELEASVDEPVTVKKTELVVVELVVVE